MNIVIASDAHYLAPAKVLLKSLAINNPGPLHIYLLHGGIESGLQRAFLDDCARFGDALHIHFSLVDDAMFQDVPVAFGLPHTTYYRFLAPALLPSGIDRALYLDCDIIVNRSVEALYRMDFEGRLLIACEDIGVSVLRKYKFLTMFDRMGAPLHQDKYFNAGVLMINMARARERIVFADVIDNIARYRQYITFSDQDILNYLYGMDTKYADYRRYNMGAGYIADDEENWVLENTSLIHYYGAREGKPWADPDKENSKSFANRLWWRYANEEDCV